LTRYEPKNKITLDHVVIIVNDLDESITHFRSLGFQVQAGGKNGPLHNALILFKDGTYIELTTTVSSMVRGLFRVLHSIGLLSLWEKLRPTLTQRFLFWLGGPIGLIDVCLRCDDLDKTLANMREQGVPVTDTQLFSRMRPDGEVASWRLAAPVNRRLPFFIEDITPVHVRVPSKEACEHENAVVGMSSIVMAPECVKQLNENIQPCVGDALNNSTDNSLSHVGAMVKSGVCR
jgi:catechol 2,3-dioxygenase-like lactoylglutathione lyase family enzyme